MNKKISLIFFPTVLIVIFLVSFVEGSEWVHYFTAPGSGDFYYDRSSINNHSNDILKIREKHTLNKNAIEKGTEYLGERYRKVDHCFILTEVNCSSRSYRTLEHSGYSQKGEIVHDIQIEEQADWYSIPEETALDALHKQVCISKGK